MAGKTDNLRLTNEQKTRLLNFALEPETPDARTDTDEEKGDLLCDILRCPLPATDRSPGHTKSVPSSFHSAFGPSLGQLLTDPKTEVTVFSRIKEYAKSLGGHATGELEKDVFLAVYFAAIAAAMTFHCECITEHAKHDLVQFFRHFAQVPWIRTDLRSLFVTATDHS